VVAQVVLVGLVILVELLGPGWPRSVAHVLFIGGLAVLALGIVSSSPAFSRSAAH
jgi:hypothetical protein